MDIANGFVAEIAPTEPDGVYSGVGYGIAAGFDVGRYIFVNERTSLYHHMCADVAELMNEAPAANHSIVIDNSPATCVALDIMTLSPTTQSWAMCE